MRIPILRTTEALVSVLLAAGLESASAQPCIEQVQWLASRVNPGTGLVDAFDDGNDSAPLYANCLASIVFTHAGRYDLAVGVFSTLQNVYEHSSIEGSGNQWHLLYDQRSATQPFEGIGDFRTGENAWLVLAINYFESLSGDQSFSAFSTNLLEAICLYRDGDTNSISYGAFDWGGLNHAFSTEFQFDIYGALEGRAALAGNVRYFGYAADLRRYLTDNPGWPPEEGKTKVWLPYAEPVFNGELYDAGDLIYLDCQPWAVLALYPPETNEVDVTQVLEGIDEGGAWQDLRETVDCGGISLTGFSDEFLPGGTNQQWVWLEGTEFVSAAYKWIGDTNRAAYYHDQVGQLLATNGTLFHSCASDGMYPTSEWPENYRFPSATTVCWYYFVEAGINPFQPPVAVPAFQQVGPHDGGRMEIRFSSVPGAAYRLYGATNLLAPNPWAQAAWAANATGPFAWDVVTATWPQVTFYVDTEEEYRFFKLRRE